MSLIPMDRACGRSVVLEAQPPPPDGLSFYQQSEQPSPDRLPQRHPPDRQSPFESQTAMNSVDVYHQYGHHPHQHHYLHRHHVQKQPVPHQHLHQLPVTGAYSDSESGLITPDVNSVACDIFQCIETEKQGLPQNNLHPDQCTGIRLEMSFNPCEDGYVSVKTHDEARFPSQVCEDVHTLSGRHENLSGGKYGQCQLHPPTSSVVVVAPRIKLLCSIGGRIMGRPVDGKLRYCGGDTRLISVEGGICFLDLMSKLSRMYGPGLSLKYQLPGEDLDALVSVLSEDDLQNMLGEYDKMVANGNNSRFRLFLFRKHSDSEFSSCFDFGLGRAECCSQVMQRYIEAINGLDAVGSSETPTDVLLENSLNGCMSTLRLCSDTSHATPSGSHPASKTFSLVPSASPSVPSSPSGPSRQVHHKQCGAGDTCHPLSKEQQNSMLPVSGLDTGTQELTQDRIVDILNCDHYQSHIPGECPTVHQELPYHRCDALRGNENGMCLSDTEEPSFYHHDRHKGTSTVQLDAWHGISKTCGIIEPLPEAHCGYHLVSQPLPSVACHGGRKGNVFWGCEPAAHSHVEGHNHFLHTHHLHQLGPPVLHWETFIPSHKGQDVGPTNQILDTQGIPRSIKEPTHIHLQNSNITSSLSARTLGSTPSSPRNVCLSTSCCCHQHFQVDRGISVSLGEHSQSPKRPHLEGHMIRRHRVPLVFSFSGSPNFYSDSDVVHCAPTSEKLLELDQPEHDAFSRKSKLTRNNTFCQLTEHGAKENAFSSLIEPLHRSRVGSPPQQQICRASFHNGKGQQLVKTRVFSTPEGQLCVGQFDPYLGNHVENIISRRLPHEFKSDASHGRIHDSVMGAGAGNGQEIPSAQNVRSASGHIDAHGSSYSPIVGSKDFQCDLNSHSFSSTDAVAGSLSSLSLEPTAWVDSCAATHNHQFKEREVYERAPPVDHMMGAKHLADGTLKNENLSDSSRTQSFDFLDCHTRVRSINSSANPAEPSLGISPVLSFTPPRTEDKIITLAEDKMTTSYMPSSQSKSDDSFCPSASSQSLPVRTSDPDDFRGSAILPMPVYDQSPISSISNAPCFLAHGERSKNVSLEKEAAKQCPNNNRALITVPHQNNGQHEEMAKTDAEQSPRRISEHDTKPVLEESKSNLELSSRHCSKGSNVQEKTLETVSITQSRQTDQTEQEVNATGHADGCPEEDDKELPATQAEAEAIARGLQIIKNDDLEDLKELGSGTYGTVFHGKWRGSDVAIKRIKPSCFMGSPSEQERLISDFWREAGTLSQLHHPNIVAFYGVVPDGPDGTLATVTEYMVNGSLKQVLMKKDRTIDRRKRMLIAMDAAFGMEYLHSKRIVHFDLKSENLLVNMRDAHRPICKVGDFGLSKVKHQTLVSGGVRGTLPWMAPELLDTKGRVTEKVDVYSFGIVMWELLTGEEPYAKMHCGTIIGGIVHDNLRPVIPTWCDPGWRDLMERCWSRKPADRPDFSSVASELRAIALAMNVK